MNVRCCSGERQHSLAVNSTVLHSSVMPTTTAQLQGLTRLEALALPVDTRVRCIGRGCVGVIITPRLFGELSAHWTENEYYDPRLRDYIGSTTWDLLDPEYYDAPVLLEVIA